MMIAITISAQNIEVVVPGEYSIPIIAKIIKPKRDDQGKKIGK